MREQYDRVSRAALALQARLGELEPEIFLTLGSGLTDVADAIEDPVEIPIDAVPGVPVSRVPGHRGVLLSGKLGGRAVLAQLGRVHLYEGHAAPDITRMVETAAALGCSTFFVTNAAGGTDPSFTPGDLMLITDHLNLTGRSPLLGLVRDGAPIFQDMGAAYDKSLRDLAVQAAEGLDGVTLQQGVYAGLLGPAFETPAEVAMLRTMGAHAVGMSTVLEVIAARSWGMRVLGISTITNVHGKGQATSHEEVLAVGAEAARGLARLVLEVVAHL